MTMKELREKRNKLIADARELVGAAVNSGAPLSGDDKTKIDTLRSEATRIGELLKDAEELDAEARAIVPESQRTGERKDENKEARDKGVTLFLRRGVGAREVDDPEIREQNLTGQYGGYTVAPDTSFYGKVQEALLNMGGVIQAPVTVLNTATGADLPIPTDDDTSNTGALVAEEGSHASGTVVTLGQTTLHAYLFSSKIVKVSWQLLQDSEVNWEGFLATKFGQRLARIKNTYFTTGTGSSQPQGVQYASTTGRTCATGSATSFTADDLVRLKYSVDVAYRNANSRWMFTDATQLIIALIKDGDGQYIWRQGLTEGSPDRLLGDRIVINSAMPGGTARLKPVLFGDFAAYFVRNVRGIQVVRLNELYAANGQVGFMAFERADGALIDAGTHPVKGLVMASS